jgi:hypothetical protein
MDPFRVVIWICVGVFAISALITLLALVGVIKLGHRNGTQNDYYLKGLFTVLIIAIVGAGAGAFKAYLGSPSSTTTTTNTTATTSTTDTMTTDDRKTARIDMFVAEPTTVVAGHAATLKWTTSDATIASIDNGIGPVNLNGQVVVTPSRSTTYTLTASGRNAPVTAHATVVTTNPRHQPDALAVLTSQIWTLHVTYIANATSEKYLRSLKTYSTYLGTSSNDVAIQFVPSSNGYNVMLNSNNPRRVEHITPVAGDPRQLSVVFERLDFGDLNPADCSRGFGSGRGARFDLNFDSTRQTLGGPVWIARPDPDSNGNPRYPYICGQAEALSHTKLP